MRQRYNYNKKLKSALALKLSVVAFVAIAAIGTIVPSVTVLQGTSSAKGGGGGGTPGDGVTYVVRYDQATCPLPESVKADYETILTCGLVKRTGQNKDFYIRVDGFTQLTPVIRDVRASVNVTLPCGNVATVEKFTENAFAQTSPVPPPYRLYTESLKFTDTCL
jgi:hypothetical protein